LKTRVSHGKYGKYSPYGLLLCGRSAPDDDAASLLVLSREVLARSPHVHHRLLDNLRRPRADPLEFNDDSVANSGAAKQIDSAGRADVMLPPISVNPGPI
jgi:hypothetical protein